MQIYLKGYSFQDFLENLLIIIMSHYHVLVFQVMGNFSDGIDISGPSTTTANSVEDCNDANSSFSSGETTGGGGGPTRTNL